MVHNAARLRGSGALAAGSAFGEVAIVERDDAAPGVERALHPAEQQRVARLPRRRWWRRRRPRQRREERRGLGAQLIEPAEADAHLLIERVRKRHVVGAEAIDETLAKRAQQRIGAAAAQPLEERDAGREVLDDAAVERRAIERAVQIGLKCRAGIAAVGSVVKSAMTSAYSEEVAPSGRASICASRSWVRASAARAPGAASSAVNCATRAGTGSLPVRSGSKSLTST